MKHFCLFSLFTIISLSGFSQYREGFIINNNNDTINGYINFEGSLLNSDHCSFKTQLNSNEQVFKPGDIKAFRFSNSKFFETKEILVNNKPQKVFIEWLIQGRASILTYTLSVSEVRYFLLLEDNSLIELTNTTREFDKDGTHYKRDNKEYANNLKFHFRDCPSLQTKIETVSFDSKSLIKITKEYHDRTCETGDCIIYEDTDRKLRLDFGVSADFLNSNLKINGTRAENVYPSNTIGYGLAIKIANLPLLSPKFSARINVIYYNSLYKYDTASFVRLLEKILVKDDRICRINNIKIPLQLTYNFSQKKLNPYISIGINLNLRLAYKEYDQYLLNYVSEGLKDKSNIGIIRPYQFGLTSGLGLNYVFSKSLLISLGYEFEYSPQFFGIGVNDYSYNMNHFIQLIVYYKNRK